MIENYLPLGPIYVNELVFIHYLPIIAFAI